MDPKGKGKKISKSKAHQSLSAYKKKLKNPKEAAFGHLFGLEKVKEFMEAIEKHNKEAEADQQIAGVRVYNCLDESRKTSDKTDVFLIPVLTNGNDLYEVNNLNATTEKTSLSKSLGDDVDDNILGEGAPCPNICN